MWEIVFKKIEFRLLRFFKIFLKIILKNRISNFLKAVFHKFCMVHPAIRRNIGFIRFGKDLVNNDKILYR